MIESGLKKGVLPRVKVWAETVLIHLAASI